MRERHWEQLSEQLGMTLKPDKEFVLSKALDMGLMDHLDTIQKVSSSCKAVVSYMLAHSRCIHLASCTRLAAP